MELTEEVKNDPELRLQIKNWCKVWLDIIDTNPRVKALFDKQRQELRLKEKVPSKISVSSAAPTQPYPLGVA